MPFVIFFIAVDRRAEPAAVRPRRGRVRSSVGGFHTEYSSLRFALFFLAEFMNTITMSAVIVTLFFGGPDGPGFHFLAGCGRSCGSSARPSSSCYVQVWIRAALPRLRYDQLMDLGWKVLIPLSLGWLLVVAGVHRSAIGEWRSSSGSSSSAAVLLAGAPRRPGTRERLAEQSASATIGQRPPPRPASLLEPDGGG